jgi:hypothetical protein
MVKGVAVTDGLIFAISNDSIIQKYTESTGMLMGSIYTSPRLANGTGNEHLSSLCIDPQSNILYASNDLMMSSILGFDYNGALLARFFINPTIGRPRDVYVTNRGIYVSLHTGYVQVYRKLKYW